MQFPRRLSCALASPIALGIACTLDAIGAPVPLLPRSLIVLVLLVIAVGAAHGALWDLAFAALARVAPRHSALVWTSLAFALATALALELGAFARLSGRYHGLALGILLACATGAALLAGLLMLLQPSRAHALGRLPGMASARVRAGLSAGLAGSAAVLFVADRKLFVGLYPSAHLALRLYGAWLVMFALVIALRQPVRIARLRRRWLVPVLAGAAAAALAQGASVEIGALELRPFGHLALEAARRGTDVDFDGFSGLFDGGDCAPFNPRVNPGAAEIPANGIDDNCLLGDAPRARTAAQRFHMPSAPSPMDVVLITVDSLRPDHVGTFAPAYRANGLATTPQLDAFASRALIFDHAFTSGGWTSIAVSSLMRGVYPRRIQWTRLFETSQFRLRRWSQRSQLQRGESLVKMFPMPLTDRHPTLGSWLARREMQTIAIADDEFSELLAHDSGVASGFRRYLEVDDLPPAQRDDSGTANLAIRTIASMPAGERLFLWVHFFGPHSPNRVHPGYRLDGPSLVQGYDHEIRYMDAQLGRLLRVLERRAEPTAVFVAADHGEEFIEGGRHHGFSVSEAALRIPLIARVPGWAAGHVQAPVSLVDLMPTILRLTGTPAPAGLDGVALQDIIAAPRARTLFADTWQYDRFGRQVRAESAAFNGLEKVVFDPLRNTWVMYDPEHEAESIHPVAARAPIPLVRALSAYVESSGGFIHLSY